MNRNGSFSTGGGVSRTRRRFVQGLAIGGTLAGLGLAPAVLPAAPRIRLGPETLVPVLPGGT